MVDRISGGNTQGVQQRQEVHEQEVHEKGGREKSPSSQVLKGRGVQQDGASPIRQHSSSPRNKLGDRQAVKQGGGKSWKERAAKLDGVTKRNKSSGVASQVSSQVSSKEVPKTASKMAFKITSLPASGKPAMPAPYKGLRTQERSATARATLSHSKSGSNFNDVRRGKFKEQFQQRAKDYDSRASELKPFQQKIYQDLKSSITSLLKKNPGDALAANKQFGELTSHARMVDDLFRGDSSYLAKLTIGDW